jgi:adenylate cyclase
VTSLRSRLSRFIDELRRRKVLTTAAGYAIGSWVLMQLGEVTFEPLHFPDWALTLLIVLVIIGFPIVLVLSWFFDLTLYGLERDMGRALEGATDRAPERSVAVLPFDDMSPERDQGYLCDGIAEEILNRLAQVDALQVASRTSSFRFRDQRTDIGTIARELKVDTVLEGSVRKAGRDLRITAQLINAADGFRLWSQSYDRELDDIFEIEDAIATCIAEALQVALALPSGNVGATDNAEAYEYYLRGQYFFYRWGLRNVRFAIDMLTHAVELDPTYARAWAALGDSNAMVCMYWKADPEYLAAVEHASSRALELAPTLAEAHVSRGLAHVLHGRTDKAVAAFERAIELDPELFAAHYFYGRVRFQQGYLGAAARLFERAAEIKPDDFQAPILLRQTYISLGRMADALREAERGVACAEHHLELNPDDIRALNLGIGGLASLGRKEQLMAWAERSLAIDDHSADTLYNIACGYAQVGEEERALDCLERADLRGTSIGKWVENDSDLAALHGNPRFIDLVERLKQAELEGS